MHHRVGANTDNLLRLPLAQRSLRSGLYGQCVPSLPRSLLAVSILLLAACSQSGSDTGSTTPTPTATTATTAPGARAITSPAKVMLIVEENKAKDQVIGSTQAPFLNAQIPHAAVLEQYDAGYPVECPSLAAYVLLTSGSAHGICDDDDPLSHPLSGPSIFSQVATSGRQWRVYAESMSQHCQRSADADPLYAVRHTAAPYYTSETGRCQKWQVPMGSQSQGALQQDVAGGTLPAFSMVVPNLCNEMHGALGCSGNDVKNGDDWLASWLLQIQAGTDYQAGRLAIVVTWDEGSSTTNHIPGFVFSPGSAGRVVNEATTHCTTLRLTEDVLGQAPLGCAQGAKSIAAQVGIKVG